MRWRLTERPVPTPPSQPRWEAAGRTGGRAVRRTVRVDEPTAGRAVPVWSPAAAAPAPTRHGGWLPPSSPAAGAVPGQLWHAAVANAPLWQPRPGDTSQPGMCQRRDRPQTRWTNCTSLLFGAVAGGSLGLDRADPCGAVPGVCVGLARRPAAGRRADSAAGPSPAAAGPSRRRTAERWRPSSRAPATGHQNTLPPATPAPAAATGRRK